MKESYWVVVRGKQYRLSLEQAIDLLAKLERLCPMMKSGDLLNMEEIPKQSKEGFVLERWHLAIRRSTSKSTKLPSQTIPSAVGVDGGTYGRAEPAGSRH